MRFGERSSPLLDCNIFSMILMWHSIAGKYTGLYQEHLLLAWFTWDQDMDNWLRPLFSVICNYPMSDRHTVYPKKYAHGFVVICFVVVMQSFIMNSHEVFIHIHQGCFAGTGAIVRLPQCQWSKPDGYGKISQCITTTKHSKAKTVWVFLGIYCKYVAWKSSYIPLFHVGVISHPFPRFKRNLVDTYH